MTVDLAMFLTENGATVQEIAIPTINGRAITGKDKLAQRFLLELLTEQGTLKYVPDRGTQFVSTLRFGALNSWEVSGAFSAALIIIKRNLINEELTTDDPAERFASASLDSIMLSTDSVSLKISINNLAGTTNKVILPLTFDCYGSQ